MDIPVDWIKLVDLAQKKMYPDITAKVRSAHNKMQALVHRVERRGLKAKKLIQFNSDYRYLMEYTEAFHCDLMIMGSHGSSGITRWFIGSTTQKVVRTSNVPVLVIRQSTPFSSIKEVVFVSGFEKRVMRSFKKVLDLLHRDLGI